MTWQCSIQICDVMIKSLIHKMHVPKWLTVQALIILLFQEYKKSILTALFARPFRNKMLAYVTSNSLGFVGKLWAILV